MENFGSGRYGIKIRGLNDLVVDVVVIYCCGLIR